MTTKIISNGSRWAGQEPATIAELLNVLERHPLDPIWAPFVHPSEVDGDTRFVGNFQTISHVFNIATDDPYTRDALMTAIAANIARPDYTPLPEPAEAKDADAEATH